VKYFEFVFHIEPTEVFRDVVLAYIEDLPFDSFEDTETGLKAYTTDPDLQPENILPMFADLVEANIVVHRNEVEPKNWNEEWEKNFSPIMVKDQILIYAPFHLVDHAFAYRIVIEPKMSFGTGHHSTTFLMCEMMLGMELQGLTMLDMGCGTGVLAILAEKLGASSVDAIDIDDWAFANTKENLERNNSLRVQAFMGDAELLVDQQYDVILANINRNILVNDQKKYDRCLKSGGYILISGFYTSDISILLQSFNDYELIEELSQNDWACLRLRKI